MNTLVEEKTATGLMNPKNKNPDGTLKDNEIMWSKKQIYDGINERLALLVGLSPDDVLPPYAPAINTFKDPKYSGPDQLPTPDELRKIKKVKVEIQGDWPALRTAVYNDIALLQARYSAYGYVFTITFGGTP